MVRDSKDQRVSKNLDRGLEVRVPVMESLSMVLIFKTNDTVLHRDRDESGWSVDIRCRVSLTNRTLFLG